MHWILFPSLCYPFFFLYDAVLEQNRHKEKEGKKSGQHFDASAFFFSFLFSFSSSSSTSTTTTCVRHTRKEMDRKVRPVPFATRLDVDANAIEHARPFLLPLREAVSYKAETFRAKTLTAGWWRVKDYSESQLSQRYRNCNFPRYDCPSFGAT